MSNPIEITIQPRQASEYPVLKKCKNTGRVFLMVEAGWGIDLSNPNAEYQMTGPWAEDTFEILHNGVCLKNA